MSSVLTQSRATLSSFALCCFVTIGQAFGQFTTIYDIPPDVAPTAIGSDTELNLFDGGSLGRDFDAGSRDNTSTNVEVNVYGGLVGPDFDALSGSTVNISGGSVGDGFQAHTGSSVDISGGSFGEQVQLFAGSRVRIHGFDFRLNGVPIEGMDQLGDTMPLDVAAEAVLTGTLADGTPFAFSGRDQMNNLANFFGDFFAPGTLTLSRAMEPPPGPSLIQLPGDAVRLGVRGGQNLIVRAGGELPDNFNAGAGSVVHVAGGNVGRNFEAAGATVNVSSGHVAEWFDAFHGTTVNVSGGEIARGFNAIGARVNITGGVIGGVIGSHFRVLDSDVNVAGGLVNREFVALGRSHVNISDGVVHSVRGTLESTLTLSGGGDDEGIRVGGTWQSATISGGRIVNGLDVTEGSRVIISGGTFGDHFHTMAGADLTLAGYGFRIDGQPIAGLDEVGDSIQVDIPRTSVFTGTLADGTPFAFSYADTDTRYNRGDDFAEETVTLRRTAVAAPGPANIHLPGDVPPLGIGAGQTLTVVDDGVVPNNFMVGPGGTVYINNPAVRYNASDVEAIGATVHVVDGIVGWLDAFEASTINIEGGNVYDVDVFPRSVVNISGGRIYGQLEVFENAVANITDGYVGFESTIESGTVNLSGGRIGYFFDMIEGVLTMTGGEIEPYANAWYGTEVNISGGVLGEHFDALDAVVNISGGTIGEAFDARSSTLVNITGGTIGQGFRAEGTSEVHISGGTFGDGFSAADQSTVSIRGGTFGERFQVTEQATLQLYGVEFLLNGEPVAKLQSNGDSVVIRERRGELISGTLLDGSEFRLQLHPTCSQVDLDCFIRTATLRLILGPVIGIAGDTNADTRINIDDLNNVRNNFGAVGDPDGSLAGDAYPFDGLVNIDDLNAVRNNFGAVFELPVAVPEPGAIVLLVLGAGLPAFGLARNRKWAARLPAAR